MFTHDRHQGRAVCTADYRRLKRGAVVPQGNELWADVEAWLAEGNALGDFAGYPDTRTLEQAKSRKLAELKHAADAEVAPILAEYPEVEVKTWDSQEREARAWTADNNSTTPTLSGISQTRGKSISYLASKVIEKADDYRDIASAAAGKRQALADAVEAATTVADVDAINW